MNTLNDSQKALKQLEKEVVELERHQTELIRKKWGLEERIRKQEELIKRLEYEGENNKNALSAWKKAALVLGVAWGIVLSFFNIDRK